MPTSIKGTVLFRENPFSVTISFLVHREYEQIEVSAYYLLPDFPKSGEYSLNSRLPVCRKDKHHVKIFKARFYSSTLGIFCF